ncbi:MAG: ABC transporter ATP-binding protein [Lachnospiraceae bacterium]|nr:ABC transporter ATP-binding protein [Lachnospiraceae bacterium]
MENYVENYVIEVENLKIRYKTVQRLSIKKSLLRLKKADVEVFEAVKGVSFKVKEGEIVGIVGRNGSGKSTMLRAIAGIFAPDEGTIDVHGRSVSLLSIGVGFQTKLTGKENIRLSGMLLGFSEAQVEAKMKEIIDFSELGDFIEKPVRTYSSGMYSKLAFSITAILETDIILIDEVLSVGDAKFRKKSFEKMKQLISDRSRTVLIVSHSSGQIQELCDTVIWLDQGKIVKTGSTDEVLAEYDEFMK